MSKLTKILGITTTILLLGSSAYADDARARLLKEAEKRIEEQERIAQEEAKKAEKLAKEEAKRIEAERKAQEKAEAERMKLEEEAKIAQEEAERKAAEEQAKIEAQKLEDLTMEDQEQMQIKDKGDEIKMIETLPMEPDMGETPVAGVTVSKSFKDDGARERLLKEADKRIAEQEKIAKSEAERLEAERMAKEEEARLQAA
ncbi:MAG: hypothetical protein IJG31_04205, partial [Fusobacterium sp.]|nr:hypothetical protein [Fusobacterium sp.]